MTVSCSWELPSGSNTNVDYLVVAGAGGRYQANFLVEEPAVVEILCLSRYYNLDPASPLANPGLQALLQLQHKAYPITVGARRYCSLWHKGVMILVFSSITSTGGGQGGDGAGNPGGSGGGGYDG